MDVIETISFIFYIVICVIIILANGFVILSILGIRSLRTAPNLLLVSLSLADFIAGCIAVPLRLSELSRLDFTLTVDYCRVSHCFTLLNITASILNLVAIAIDRYIAIKHPFRYVEIQSKPTKYTLCLIMSAWLIALTATFLPLYAWGSNNRHDSRNRQMGICKFNETLVQGFIFFILIGVEAVSILIILTINIRIYIVARAHSKRIVPVPMATIIEDFGAKPHSEIATAPECRRYSEKTATLFLTSSARELKQNNIEVPCPTNQVDRASTSTKSRSNSNNINQLRTFQTERRKLFLRSWKTAKTMFIIFLIFAVCWLAFIVSAALFVICPPCANKYVIMICTIVIFTSSAINPFIFFFRIKSFRKETILAGRKFLATFFNNL